ncbi:MAG: hypothetical protein IJF83_11530 [Methanobrevibacter sp.]|nr:hypothetical protein [Methanobrevibacter sp.]
MERKHIIIIIGILLAIFIILCGYIGYALLTPQTTYITYNITESGTTLEIPSDMTVKSNNTESGITVLENDNTIIVIFNSADKNIGQIMSFANIKNPIFGSEYEGNTTLNDPTVAGCNLEGKCNAVYTGNDETHDNIIVISKNENIVNHIFNSIRWGNGAANTTSAVSIGNGDTTYPFYGDDGSIVGYYHVGDTITHHDVILKLQPNGQWVQIGVATPSEPSSSDDGGDNVDSESSSDDSGSDGVETTTDDSSG